MPISITAVINNPEYENVSSYTSAYVYAANDVYKKPIFEGTISDSKGRMFAYGETPNGCVFMDLECPHNTVHDEAYIKSLGSHWTILTA